MDIIRIPAISPENNGDGETEKAEKLLSLLQSVGFDEIICYDALDSRVFSKKRPNIVAHYHGKNHKEKLWIVTYLDVVPPGDESKWTSKPFNPMTKEGRIYGRGSEDNGQSLVASIFAVKSLSVLNIKPPRTISLAFVADEEQGSTYGIKHLLSQGIFRKDDLILVPDGGTKDGHFIETAEKSILWFKVHTKGRQCHASRPEKGLNAHRIGIKCALALDTFLHKKYSLRNSVFNPLRSTFEITRKDPNVNAINIVPGEDTIYFDCRVLPAFSLNQILNDLSSFITSFEQKTECTITFEILQRTDAPTPTHPSSKIVILLRETLKKVRNIEPHIGGVGSGTCAAFFRKQGIPSVVWNTIDGTAHQPNEYAKIENIVNDSKIFATFALSQAPLFNT